MRKIIFAIMSFAALTVIGQLAFAVEEVVKGEVRKVDTSAGKITLRHGPIKKFGMDEGMTMVFRVKDPAMLGAVKVGDKVNFEAEKVNGQFTVIKIEKAK